MSIETRRVVDRMARGDRHSSFGESAKKRQEEKGPLDSGSHEAVPPTLEERRALEEEGYEKLEKLRDRLGVETKPPTGGEERRPDSSLRGHEFLAQQRRRLR